jgi:hypothetical protein
MISFTYRPIPIANLGDESMNTSVFHQGLVGSGKELVRGCESSHVLNETSKIGVKHQLAFVTAKGSQASTPETAASKEMGGASERVETKSLQNVVLVLEQNGRPRRSILDEIWVWSLTAASQWDQTPIIGFALLSHDTLCNALGCVVEALGQ